MISKMRVGLERRKHHRYDLSFPVRLQSRSKTKTAPPIETATKNMSAHGVYVVLSERPVLGTVVDMEIRLPVKFEPGKSVMLRCRAKVARVELLNAEGLYGVGAIIEDYQFLREAILANQNALRTAAYNEVVPEAAALSLAK